MFASRNILDLFCDAAPWDIPMICRPFPLNRTSFLSIALGLLVPWSCMPAGAQLPDGGVRLVDPGSLSPSNMSVRVGNGELGSSSLVNVQHEAFDQALQINLTKRPHGMRGSAPRQQARFPREIIWSSDSGHEGNLRTRLRSAAPWRSLCLSAMGLPIPRVFSI
jgi:hypothetical protein